MKLRMAVGGLVLVAALSAFGQNKPAITPEGGSPDDRASARILYLNNARHEPVGQFAIDYGRPVWKGGYEDAAKFDAMTKGKTWRLGSNFWTTLDTCVPLKISGKKVAVGYYYLGLHRSDDGSKWSLAFIDPAKVRAMHLDASQIARAPISFEAPMENAAAASKAEKLTIELSYAEGDSHSATLKVTWGTLALTAPVEITVPE